MLVYQRVEKLVLAVLVFVVPAGMIVNRLCIKPGYLDALSSAKVWLHFRHWRLACARGLWGLEGGGMNSKIDHFGKLGAIQIEESESVKRIKPSHQFRPSQKFEIRWSNSLV